MARLRDPHRRPSDGAAAEVDETLFSGYYLWDVIRLPKVRILFFSIFFLFMTLIFFEEYRILNYRQTVSLLSKELQNKDLDHKKLTEGIKDYVAEIDNLKKIGREAKVAQDEYKSAADILKNFPNTGYIIASKRVDILKISGFKVGETISNPFTTLVFKEISDDYLYDGLNWKSGNISGVLLGSKLINIESISPRGNVSWIGFSIDENP